MARFTKTTQLGVVFGGIAVIIVVGIVLTIVTRPASRVAAIGRIAITAGVDTCGAGWADSKGGALTFTVTNASLAGIEVYLQNAKSGLVYGEIEGLGSGASADFSVTLGNGSYRFVCLGDESPAATGATVTISDSTKRAALTPGILPVTQNDLFGPSKLYQAWISARLPALESAAETLATDVRAAGRTAAQNDWTDAHVQYEQLGAAYGAFGAAGAAIDGDPAPGLTAATDPHLTGFRRIEAILWSGSPVTDAAAASQQLAADISALQSSFATARLNPADLGLRAHEIMENTIQDQLNGDSDAGSGTTLATVDANIAGTIAAIEPLRALLASRGYDLEKTDEWLARAAALVESFHQLDGRWTPITGLSTADRQKLNATLNQTVELLAPIAAICEVRRGADS
jgi:iron uptake system component EfeO